MWRRLAAMLPLVLLCGSPLRAQHGGGHFSGGRGSLGGGHSIGHAVGHSVGSSFGHFFGHRSVSRGNRVVKQSSDAPPLTGAAMIRGRVIQLPNPQKPPTVGRPRFHHAPLREFAFPKHFGASVFGLNSFSGFCSPRRGFFGRPILFSGDFDCFRASFFFDPFFLAGFDPLALDTWNSGVPLTAFDLSVPTGDAQLAEEKSPEEKSLQTDNEAADQDQRAAAPAPYTLLQLTSGSMYALASYWQEGGRLHYVTSYGGENSVPLDQIDFDKTIQLNAKQGIKFEIRPKPAEKP